MLTKVFRALLPAVVSPVLVVSAAAPAVADEISTPAIKDSTILRSTVSAAGCPDLNAYKCTLGRTDTLQANTGGLAYVRALIGFQLAVPPSSVTRCTVQLAAFTKPLHNPVEVTVARAASAQWDEDAVDGENAPESGKPFTVATAWPHANLGPIDITPACKRAASDGQFSIYVGVQTGEIEVWSKDSGNPAILHVTQAQRAGTAPVAV
ncbi:hypothetical protein ABZ863_27140 [Saccharomonospora sp. NPDC046836]|uniref:CBM96 family carbohydrate-binding protein n=1 Tax=Saccharomonospora sp. NPDC046836 TaxID=3156921 RepID=UPI0033FEF842